VQIRVPKVVGKFAEDPKGGPGPKGDKVEESLPKKYHDETELTFDVKSGSQTKDWELKR
jgi:hypothetical protein